LEILSEIMAGGAEAARDASCPIVGGHSVDDVEPKYGLAVTGLVNPRRVLTNAKAKAGDVLLLGKSLGTGIAVSAIKKGTASTQLIREATAQMRQLNREASQVYVRHFKQVHALTDVTGFGLLGHLDSMMRASKTAARIDAAAVRVLAGVRELARDGVVPGGSKANLEFVLPRTVFPAQMSEADRLVLADAQTHGGLLAAVTAKAAPKIQKALADAGSPAVAIGEVLRAKEPGIDVRGEISTAPLR
jgi:selenide,water dikinase